MPTSNPYSVVQPPPQDPDWLKPFLTHCHRRRYPAKTEFIPPPDTPDRIFYLVPAQVTICLEDEEGREIILSYLNKGDFIGEMGLFMPMPKRSVMVRTRSSCELAEISYSKLEQLFEGDLKPYTKDILYALGAQLTQRLLHTSRKVGHLAFLDVTGRIAGTLLELCKRIESEMGRELPAPRGAIPRRGICARSWSARP